MAFSGKKRNRVTLLDVAREAGVSRATASLVIRKSPLVSSDTRRRVEETLERLGYVYNMGAARMRAARSQTVGVIIPNLGNPFFAEMLAGIEAMLDMANMVVILANSGEEAEKQQTIIRRMREHGVDGLIVCPAAGTGEALLANAAEWRLPLVQALRHVSGTAGDYAGSDYIGGMQRAVCHLHTLGHRHIVFLNGDIVHSAQTERLAGFRAGMRECDLADDRVITIPLTQKSATEAASWLREGHNPPTAAICFNDIVGLGLSSGLYDLGVEVGRDFSVIGFDNVPEANLVRPKLTSVATYPGAIGKAAAQLLLDRLESPDRPPQRVIVPTKLVERHSCGPPKRSGE